ncbi:DUF2637 domain-containing protein [Micromonospora sp. WMMD1102]|uniref:DUF2637 domain-containing protein n=1 Tax=Micromonospora sp. WMMD1102 TaxID=3016105 RepID=UPI0024155BAF|nr:DUF2637 domain-containing protein [Micromonospora sp. WMMD1102]MDG4785857.1 DUF2637 domain-containing protein [Micromonospora sp. WMMD1102]
MPLPQLRRVRWAVRATLALGVAASVVANVLHARDNPISQAIAAWPPLALLLTVELISRVPVHRRSLAFARMAATATIAGIAAWVSYWHMVGVAARYGETGASPYLLPLSVDGLIVVASICLVELGGRISAAQAATTADPASTATAAATATAIPSAPAVEPAVPTQPAGRNRDEVTTIAPAVTSPGTAQPTSTAATRPAAAGPARPVSTGRAQPVSTGRARPADTGVARPASLGTGGSAGRGAARAASAGAGGSGTPVPGLAAAAAGTVGGTVRKRGSAGRAARPGSQARPRRPITETAALAAAIQAERPEASDADVAQELGITTARLRAIRREVRDLDLVA